MLFGKKKEKEQRSVLEEEQMQSPSYDYKKSAGKQTGYGRIDRICINFCNVLHPSDLVSPGFKLSGSNTEKYRTGIFIPFGSVRFKRQCRSD